MVMKYGYDALKGFLDIINPWSNNSYTVLHSLGKSCVKVMNFVQHL